MTKAELAEENAALRDLIAAVKEIAGSAPRASHTDPSAKRAEYEHCRDVLIRIWVLADLDRGSASPGLRARVLRGYAARPLPYTPAGTDANQAGRTAA